MGRKRKFTQEIMLQAINDYKSGNKSITQTSNDLECSEFSIRRWVQTHDSLLSMR